MGWFAGISVAIVIGFIAAVNTNSSFFLWVAFITILF